MALLSFIVWGPSLSAKKKGARGVIAGLYNPRNLCFVNSVAQSLASCQLFISWLQTRLSSQLSPVPTTDFSSGGRPRQNSVISQSDKRTADKHCLLDRLHELLTVLNCSHPTIDTDAFSCERLLCALKAGGWCVRVGEEQDAHEFFQLLAGLIETPAHSQSGSRLQCCGLLALQSHTDGDGADDQSCSDRIEGCFGECVSLQRATSCQLSRCLPVSRPFSAQFPFLGSLTTQLICRSCSFKCPVSCQQFVSLSLCVPTDSDRAVSFSAQRSVLSLLAHFTTPEIVTDVLCDRCHIRGRFTKRTLIGKCPPLLCLHLSRLQWLQSGQAVKITGHVVFPDRLSLDPFTLAHVVRGQAVRSWSTREVRLRLREPQYQYRLCAVLVHTGGHNDGHFFTYRLRQGSSGDRWYRVSDLLASRVQLDEVLNSCAYMLFYERCSSSKLSNSSY